MNRITQEDIELFSDLRLFNRYQSTATKNAEYPGKDTYLGLVYCALKLNGEAGELADHIGKAMRDDDLMNHELTQDRRELIIKEVGDCLWYLAAICNELGISFSSAAFINLVKIKDRYDRGVQHGSGDNR